DHCCQRTECTVFILHQNPRINEQPSSPIQQIGYHTCKLLFMNRVEDDISIEVALIEEKEEKDSDQMKHST
ncbi:hypothetical protein PENTCL1PPCAC_17297, partial [Pristionchus entomophagus]